MSLYGKISHHSVWKKSVSDSLKGEILGSCKDYRINNFSTDEIGLMRLGSSNTYYLKDVSENQYNMSEHAPHVHLETGEDIVMTYIALSIGTWKKRKWNLQIQFFFFTNFGHLVFRRCSWGWWWSWWWWCWCRGSSSNRRPRHGGGVWGVGWKASGIKTLV